MNTTKGYIKIFPKLERGTVEYRVRVCWLITAEGRHHMVKIKRQKKRK